VNEGIPIVIARPQSEPAEAFRRLADLLGGPAGEEALALEATNGGGNRLRLFGRKA
jgi:MinD-like ATPase involved in chromosome partitioning or flagellar assembly